MAGDAGSDVVWLVRSKQATDQKSSLMYVFRHDIVTVDTKRIVERAAGVGMHQLNSCWPEIKFHREGDGILSQQGVKMEK